MVSVKAVGAIALTLMIAVPILLGFALASDTETKDVWVTDSTVNVTDLLYNNETPYFTEYINPNNNKSILQKQVYPGAGVTEWHSVSPSYVSVGSNYTSLPTYTTATEQITLNTSYTVSTALDYNGQYQSVGSATSDAQVKVATRDMMLITISTSQTAIHWQLALDDDEYYTVSDIFVMKDSADSWLFKFDNHSVSSTTWKITTSADGTVTTKGRAYTTLSPSSDDYSFSTSTISSVVLTYNDNTKTYLALTDTATISHASSGVTYIGSVQYTDVDTVGIATPHLINDVSVEYLTESGNYADTAYGWSLPTVSGATTYDWWYNGQLNESVRMMVYFPSDGYVYLGPATDTSGGLPITLRYDNSVLYVNGTALGGYNYAMVVMDTEKATVYGINSWPSMGSWPTTYNSIEVDYTDVGLFYYIKMQSSGTTALYRVDSANIVAGYFPDTKDLTYDFNQTYPQRDLVITFKSVAVYGDSLTIGGQTYSVTDGKFTVTDTDGETYTVPVRKMTVRMIYDSDSSTYTVSINGHVVNEGGNAQIHFGGEWSAIISLSTISVTQSSQMVWKPGEFAFDKQDFAACGLIVAGACLVGLGMYGGRSGTKMGILLMVCGGGALIYLTLI